VRVLARIEEMCAPLQGAAKAKDRCWLPEAFRDSWNRMAKISYVNWLKRMKSVVV